MQLVRIVCACICAAYISLSIVIFNDNNRAFDEVTEANDFPIKISRVLAR